MNPELLKTFLAIAKHASFTRGAQERLLTQPAVSRQIKQLEQGFGVALFERLGKSVHLSEAGRTLAPLAARILAQLDRVIETVQGCGTAEHGRLRIGASTTPGYYVLPPVLGRFRREHPGVELHFTVENSHAIESRILHNELDLGFVGARLTNEALLIEPIGRDEIICFCGASHPFARKRRLPPKSLADATWIVRERGSATRQLFEKWLSAARVSMRHVIELSSPEAIKALVREGVGISFMSIHGLKAELHDGQLKRIAIPGRRLTREIYLVHHADKYVSPTMRSFLQLLPRA